MKKYFAMAGLAVLIPAAGTFAQQTTTTTTTTKKEMVKNADGSWTVIEYPVGKEVTVNLSPATTIPGAKGNARILRSADGTKVWLDMTGVTGDMSTYYAYAVDPSGRPTLLGPVTVTDGVAKAEFSTPLNQFMLYVSPNGTLTTLDPATPYFFRSDLPSGYAVVPRMMTSDSKSVASGEPIASAYEVPLLNVPSFKGDTEVRVKFDGELSGLDGKAYLNPKRGKTQVKMRFSDLKKVPANKRFVLWARGADGQFAKLGQIINSGAGKSDEAEIRSETALRDFGLFVTVEDAEVTIPTSRTYSVFTVPVVNR
ncbi:MAG: hypothetical protein ABR535_00535 [Pyrinomonadaceae bacterium]